MRRHVRKFFPLVLIALMVQIFAPIGAGWAAARAAADPLLASEICDSGGVPTGQGDQVPGHHGHEACLLCCAAAQAGAAIDAPQVIAVAVPVRPVARVVWRDAASDIVRVRTGSPHQARAPPFVS
jgi:hypothetical protein